MPQEMLPKIALILGLKKFKKFCKIKVVGEEWAENPTVYAVGQEFDLLTDSFFTTFIFRE